VGAVGLSNESLDKSGLEAILIRWKLAEEFLLEEADTAGTAKMAIHVLLSHDMPLLFRELGRLRPDLGL